MIRILGKIRVLWWERAYKKIWKNPIYRFGPTCSTKTEEEAHELASFISSKLPVNKIKVALDVGCGNGNLGDRVFKDCALLIQTDYCFEAIEAVKVRPQLKKYIIASDAGRPSFKKNIFDCILLYSLIHNSGCSKNALRWVIEMLSLLKSEGVLYIGDIPIKKMLYKRLWSKFKGIKCIHDIKYFFAELMQNSFAIDDFLGMEGVSQLRVFPRPENIRFHEWRVDIEIIKK